MKKEYYWLGAIILISLAARLFFSLQTPEFTTDTAYYTLRQVTHIHDTTLPLFNDPLSYGGRTSFLLPLFYYLLALLTFFFKSHYALKIVIDVFALSLIVVVYVIAKHITKGDEAALFSAALAAALPVVMRETLNTLSIRAVIIPLIFICIYIVIRIEEKTKWIMALIGTLLFLRLSTTNVIFFIMILWVYKGITVVKRMPRIKLENEAILFATVLIIWTLFVGFKNVFLEHGIGILWQAIPPPILEQYFAGFTLFSLILSLGVVPLVMGSIAVVRTLSLNPQREAYPFISAIIVGVILWVFQLIDPIFALILVAVSLCILSGITYQEMVKIKNKALRRSLHGIAVIAVLAFMVVPATSEAGNNIAQAYTPQEIDALRWAQENTPDDSVIVSSIPDGHLVTAIAERKNVMDTNFLFAKEVESRILDLYAMYRGPSQTELISLMQKYNASYIYVSSRSVAQYNLNVPPGIDENCFEKSYSAGNVSIYKRKCRLEIR